MMKSKVVLVRCGSYEYGSVKDAVEKGISLLGGAGQFVNKDEEIVLKVNLLVGDAADKCVTTHPMVFRAVAEVIKAAGANVKFGDSPSIGSPVAASRKAGLLEIANDLEIGLADFENSEEIYFDKGIQNKKFSIARGVEHADGIISLPKMKTHALERFTGCIKNQFGCVVGMRKGEFHVKLSNAHDFGKMLVDLNNYIHPRLYVMDGIMAMEGNGPRGGKPRAMNVLLFSSDPVALDATACRMIGLDPEFVPTTLYLSLIHI